MEMKIRNFFAIFLLGLVCLALCSDVGDQGVSDSLVDNSAVFSTDIDFSGESFDSLREESTSVEDIVNQNGALQSSLLALEEENQQLASEVARLNEEVSKLRDAVANLTTVLQATEKNATLFEIKARIYENDRASAQTFLENCELRYQLRDLECKEQFMACQDKVAQSNRQLIEARKNQQGSSYKTTPKQAEEKRQVPPPPLQQAQSSAATSSPEDSQVTKPVRQISFDEIYARGYDIYLTQIIPLFEYILEEAILPVYDFIEGNIHKALYYAYYYYHGETIWNKIADINLPSAFQLQLGTNNWMLLLAAVCVVSILSLIFCRRFIFGIAASILMVVLSPLFLLVYLASLAMKGYRLVFRGGTASASGEKKLKKKVKKSEANKQENEQMLA